VTDTYISKKYILVSNFISLFFLVLFLGGEERKDRWISAQRKKKVIVRKDLGYQNSSFLCQIVSYDEGS